MNNPIQGAKSLVIFHLTIMELLKRYLDIFYEHRCAVKFALSIVRRIINNNRGATSALFSVIRLNMHTV